MAEDLTWNPQVQPDFDKLGKLDKLLGKIDGDIQKRVKDQDRPAFVETLKKCHEIYQLVLGELHFQFCELQLESFGDIIMKIFTGQNTLINILLKMKTNLDFNPDELMSNLRNMKRGQVGGKTEVRRASLATGQKNDSEIIPPVQMPGRTKFQKARDMSDQPMILHLAHLAQKKEELDELKQEMEEGQDELQKFLDENKAKYNEFDASQAEKNLKGVLKDLVRGKKKMQDLENEEALILQGEQEVNRQFDSFGSKLVGQFQNMRMGKNGVPIPDVLSENQKVINGVLIEVAHIDTQTEQEKKQKEALMENEILNNNIKKLLSQQQDLKVSIEKMKLEEKRLRDEIKSQIVMGSAEKDRLKELVSENFRMKLKIRELFDLITQLEKDNKSNIQKFKNFIMNSKDLTEEQKRLLISKVEDLFTVNISSKINMKELEKMSRLDENMFKDKFFKDCIGDPTQLLKQIKVQEKDKKQKMKKQNYNADFDPDLLEDHQEIVIRKVKKKIRRRDSKTGEWIEEEIEVEEECVIDKKTGEVIRKREVEQQGAAMARNMQKFMDQHGGLAVGGAKFKKPQNEAKRPKRKDGQAINEGEWFEDENGNIVRMVKGKNGEEVFEIKETYIDENGVQRERIKKMKYKVDSNGNQIVEEEFIDPKTGKKLKIEKKTFKDKDGNEVFEEVTTDSQGRKKIKRTKVKKDKDGNEIIEEEIIDENGNRQIIRTKVVKDKNGNDVIIQEILNSDGTKTIVTETVDEFGNKIVVKETIHQDGTRTIVTETLDKDGTKTVKEEKVDRRGKKKLVAEKVMKMGKDGKIEVEEYRIDENGSKIKSNTRTEVGEDGVVTQVTTTVGADGKTITVKKKIIKNEKGEDVEITETVDANGNVVTKKVIRRIDEDGNEIIEEEIIDSLGNRIIKTKKINADGTITEEEYNPETGERKVKKIMRDKNGKEIIEETIVDKNGKVTVKNQVITKDANGNEVLQEIKIDPKTGKQITVNKKIIKGKDGHDIIEETEVDEHGNKKQVRTKKYIDKDGAEITEKEIIGADGKKQKIKQKKYIDANGNEVIEEETVDEFGNKVIQKRVINKDGTETIEKITVGKDGKKHIVRQEIKDGMVQETIIHADGRIEQNVRKQGLDEKYTQTDEMAIESILGQLGLSPEQVAAIKNYIQTGQGLPEGSKISQKMQQKLDHAKNVLLRKQQQEEERLAKLQKIQEEKMKKEVEENSDDEDKLEVIDDNMDQQQQEDALYKNMKKGGPQLGDLQRQIRNFLGLDGDAEITPEMFRDYLRKFKEIHYKCGEECPHLKRFYAKLGFIHAKWKRKFIKMKDNKITAFEKKLPKI